MKNFLFVLTLAYLIVLATACGNNNAEPNTDVVEIQHADDQVVISKEQFDHSQMAFGNLVQKELPVTIPSGGYLEVTPGNRATVSVYYGGFVTKLAMIPGDVVRRGELLFEIENPDFIQMQQDYIHAKENLAVLKAAYERQQLLLKRNISAKKNFLAAESQYKSTLAVYNGSRKRLELLGISLAAVEAGKFTSRVAVNAPIAGTVTEVNVTLGAFLTMADIAMEIINTTALHLELSVFEKDILKLKPGQPVTFFLPSEPEKKFTAVVHLINNKIDDTKRTVLIHCDLLEEKNQHMLLPGMYVEAAISVDEKVRNILPENAVISVEDKHFVLIQVASTANKYTFKQLPVVPGHRANGFIEILDLPELLTNNSKVVTEGAYNIIINE